MYTDILLLQKKKNQIEAVKKQYVCMIYSVILYKYCLAALLGPCYVAPPVAQALNVSFWVNNSAGKSNGVQSLFVRLKH